MLLNGSAPVCIGVDDAKIATVEAAVPTGNTKQIAIHFSDAIAFPGLINSHDHLDFNCFKPLGNRKYNNYTGWGSHIHEEYKKDIDSVLKIPQELRTRWGVYKNLLAGVTTVVNHGMKLEIKDPLIDVLQCYQDLHSVGFETHWKWKLNNPVYRNKTCVMHTGEGVDRQSHIEITRLLKYNFLKKKLVGVHGVAMDASQAKGLEGMVWCPESNEVLLGHHADIGSLKTETNIVFGTDSTLTGRWNIWRHLRLARSLSKVSDKELYGMITGSPARLWCLNGGALMPDRDAGIVVAGTKGGEASFDAFFGINPEDILMVMHKGQIRMFDESIISQLTDLHICLYKFSRIIINGAVKFVEGDLPDLISAIKNYNQDILFPVRICEATKTSING